MSTLRGCLDSHAHEETWDLRKARPGLPKLIRHAIGDSGLSAGEVASWMSVTSSRLSAAIDGTSELTVAELEALSGCLGLSVDELLDGSPARLPQALGRRWRELECVRRPPAMRILGNCIRDVVLLAGLEDRLGTRARLPPWRVEGKSLSPPLRAQLVQSRVATVDRAFASVGALLSSFGVRLFLADNEFRSVSIRAPRPMLGIPAATTHSVGEFRFAVAAALSDLLFGAWEHRQLLHVLLSGEPILESDAEFGRELVAVLEALGPMSREAEPLPPATIQAHLAEAVGAALSAKMIVPRRARQLLRVPASDPLPFAFLGDRARPLVDDEMLAIRLAHAHLAAAALPFVALEIERIPEARIRVRFGEERDGRKVEHGYVIVDMVARSVVERVSRSGNESR